MKPYGSRPAIVSGSKKLHTLSSLSLSGWRLILLTIDVAFRFTTQPISKDVYKSKSNPARCDQARGGDDLQTLKSYINPSHGACDPFGTFSIVCFSVFRRVDVEPCLAHSTIQILHQTNTRARKRLASVNVPNGCFWTVLCSSVHL